MFQRLDDVEKRYEELNGLISDPDVIAKQNEWKKLMKEHSDLEEVVMKYREYKKVSQDLEEAKEMLNDPEMKELAEAEMLEDKEKLPKIEEELKILLIPKDPNDDNNVICEIRAGAGGEEAALFAGVLFRMYSMYAEKKHFQIQVLNENETGIGGYKEISFMIKGKGAYSRFKFESGVHRVQRVPDTESSGRIHTSTATVAVLPEVEDVEVDINPADIKMEVFRASGAGGQHVNKTSSAVRLIHEPTGIVAECQTERSQLQNREYAMKLLRSRIYEIEREKQEKAVASERRSQVGSGDRSEKIRTYNYPQGRITDHRIGLSIYQMENFLNGDMDEMIDNLIATDRAEKLKGDKIMKIVIPSKEEKLCGHFGHCEYFTFAEVNPETKEIISIEKKVPEDGISCQSASWISSQGANLVLAGGMGGRPLQIFAQNGAKVVVGCPELEVEEVINQYFNDTLSTGENSCGGEHHHCHGHRHEHKHCSKI